MKLVPRHDSTEEHEGSNVQDVFDCGIEGVMSLFDFKVIGPIPVQCTAGNKAGKSLVRAKAATGTDNKQLQDILAYAALFLKNTYTHRNRI